MWRLSHSRIAYLRGYKPILFHVSKNLDTITTMKTHRLGEVEVTSLDVVSGHSVDGGEEPALVVRRNADSGEWAESGE